MENGFEIPFRLPSLNEVTLANRTHWAKGAKQKKEVQEQIAVCIMGARAAGNLRPVTGQCTVHFTWHERTRRRDVDNVASGKKFILDALQETGILPNDNSRYVKGFTDKIHYGAYDGVTVEIEE